MNDAIVHLGEILYWSIKEFSLCDVIQKNKTSSYNVDNDIQK